MEYIIKGRKPEQVFRFFEEICAIPHGSGNEKGIADYLVKFANDRGLFVYRDAVHNVFIRKEASKGRENDAPMLLQAHTDMVCEKNDGTDHDFLTDPLKLYIDGKYLRAKGTTLGADDGAGVALMLAALDGAFESHPMLECLFTVSEETGMDGVNNFDFSLVSAKRMLNLDNAELEKAIVGCAGGVRSHVIVKGNKTQANGTAVKISVNGLAGGHSGENIKDGRENANKIMGRILLGLRKKCNYFLSEINGGGKPNAIPRECKATIVTDDPDTAVKFVNDLGKIIAAELGELDRNFNVVCKETELPQLMFDADTTKRTVYLLGIVANGVLEMSKRIEGFVEYSRNQGVIKTNEDGVEFLFFARSAIDAQLEASNCEIEALAELCGAEVHYAEQYHGWDYEPESKLREEYVESYKAITGKDLKICAIHAGLECGIVKAAIPDIDILAVGPNELDIHSPDEALDLDSAETLCEIVNDLLKK